MQLAPLAIIAAIGYGASTLPSVSSLSKKPHFLDRPVDYSRPQISTNDTSQKNLDEFEDGGFSYGFQRSGHLDMTNLNEAWKPYGPPRQETNLSLLQVYQGEAARNGYLETFGAIPYINRQPMEIPLASNQQGNPSVSVPSASLSGPLAPLLTYPRLYVDDENYDKGQEHAEKNWDTWGAHFFPSEHLVQENYDDEGGYLQDEINPWGLDGAYIKLFKSQHQNNFKAKADIITGNAPHYY